MAVVNGYATRAELASWLTATGISDQEAERLDLAIEAASRDIDARCSRRFYADAAVSARTYEPIDYCRAFIDDVSTLTGLIVKTDLDGDGVYEVTWDATDFELEPYNNTTGEPWTELHAVGPKTFPTFSRYYRPPYPLRRRTLQVTAKWGWATVPAPVRESCLILASNLWRRKDNPFGVTGFADAGLLRIRDDPDVTSLLAPYSIRVPTVA